MQNLIFIQGEIEGIAKRLSYTANTLEAILKDTEEKLGELTQILTDLKTQLESNTVDGKEV